MGSSISSLLFQPPPCTFLHPTRHIWLHPTPTTKIPAFHITNGNDITVLFSHGNAEDLGMIYDWFVEFSKVLSVDVFCYDYTGYGKSTGPKPSEEKTQLATILSLHYEGNSNLLHGIFEAIEKGILK